MKIQLQKKKKKKTYENTLDNIYEITNKSKSNYWTLIQLSIVVKES